MVEHFPFIVRLAFRVVFVLAVFVGEAFAELTTAAAVHHGLVAVLAKVFGNVVLVGVEADDNDRLAEGRGQEGQQQKKGSALTEHVRKGRGIIFTPMNLFGDTPLNFPLPDAHLQLWEQFFAKAESDRYFTTPWRQRERKMYDKMVLDPRLTAYYGGANGLEWTADLLAIREKVELECGADRRAYQLDFSDLGIGRALK